jgi:hypothetical protein
MSAARRDERRAGLDLNRSAQNDPDDSKCKAVNRSASASFRNKPTLVSAGVAN